jgi:transcriptional regulator with XRE-family HTH domain
MNDFAERIKMLMSALNIKTTRQLAEECSIVESTIGRQLKGERPINLDTITSILNSYPDVSAEWLMRGEEPMLKSENKPTTPKHQVPFLERLTAKLCEESIEYVEDICNITTSYYRIRKNNKEKNKQ